MLTKLQMVQRISEMCGIGAPQSLDPTNTASVYATIERFIDDHNRQLQNENRWSVSVEDNITLTPDETTGEITVPAGAMVTVSSMSDSNRRIIQRGSKLYDLDNNTYVFERDLIVKVSYLYDVECIPEHLQSLVAARAAVQFTEYRLDNIRYAVVQDRERKAYALAVRVDGDILKPSVEGTHRSRRILGNTDASGSRWR
jgi:hypothetical protein